MKFDAVILAGSGHEEWLEREGVPNKSLLEIDGRPMIEYTLRALKGSAYCNKNLLVCDFPLPDRLRPLVDLIIPAGATIEENISRGAQKAEAELVIILGGDIPFLESRDLDQIVASCGENPASLYLPVVKKEDIEARFPGSKRTYARLREGEVKAGNMLLYQSESWPIVERFMAQVIAGRKKLWKLARILGWRYVIKFAAGSLSIPELEQVVARFIGGPARAIRVKSPGLGIDVDKLEDLIMTRAILEK